MKTSINNAQLVRIYCELSLYVGSDMLTIDFFVFRYGLECVFRFYSYGLEKRFRMDLFQDFQEAVKQDYNDGKIIIVNRPTNDNVLCFGNCSL